MIATATNQPIDATTQNPWSAVGSMTLCVSMLIAAEFLPVSLLTPIAADLRATEGMAGQAISISGLFAVVASLFIATIAGRFDRRHVLIVLTGLMLASLVLIAEAQNFAVFMAARAPLGITIGGFGALATATIMRLVRQDSVPKAWASSTPEMRSPRRLPRRLAVILEASSAGVESFGRSRPLWR